MAANIVDTFREARVTAIIRTKSAEFAAKAMEAAVRGGIRVLEFTWTTPGAVAGSQPSLVAKSSLSKGEVAVEMQLPEKPAKKTLLRLRLPDGYKVQSAEKYKVDADVIDLTGAGGRVSLVAKVAR